MTDATATRVPDAERFARTLAELLVLGLTTYVPMLRVLHDIGEGDTDPRQLETLQEAGRRVGVELLAFAQAAALAEADLVGSAHDPAPVLELARRVGTGAAMLLRVTDAASARETPVTPIPVVQEAYGDDARAWLGRYVPVLPEFVEAEEPLANG
ncbi:MAG: hypothetical protein JHC95_09860 [Solirubrobacteraceae bacterium]|nr:hypothetical protein [Solirubrobacteraceae bacterium]